jgi:hypothetical protein
MRCAADGADGYELNALTGDFAGGPAGAHLRGRQLPRYLGAGATRGLSDSNAAARISSRIMAGVAL